MVTNTSCTGLSFISFFLLGLFRSAFSLPCSSFFDLTVDNFRAADLAAYYKPWALAASAKPEFLSYGEVGLFFREKLGTDIKCDVSRMGCKGLPTCVEIRDIFSGNDEEARRVYFISKIVDNMSLFAGLAYRATTDVQIDTSNILPAAAETFFWQPNTRNIELCGFIGQGIKDLISFSIVMSFSLFPPLLIPAAGAAVVESNLPWIRVAAGNAMRNPWIANSIQMFPGTYISQGVDKGCSRFLPIGADQRLEHIGQLGRYLRVMLMAYRRDISSSILEINRGTGFGENGTIVDGQTVLADLISGGAYFIKNEEARDRFISDPFQLEDVLTQWVTNGIISVCLTSSQCYLSCTEYRHLNLPTAYRRDITQEGAEGFCDVNAPQTLATSRLCPQPNIVCQAQCWRPSLRAKNVPVYGMAELENSLWNVRIEDMLTASYSNYAGHGTANPIDSLQARAAAGFRIPVCKSALMQIGDISRHGRKNNGVFPCSCGDVYSNETSSFLAAAGFSTNSHKKELRQKCPRQLNKMVTLSVEFYLALCALSVHWPLNTETRFIKSGSDSRCAKVREDVEEREAAGMNRMEMNRWFCTQSAEGLALRKEERHWVAFSKMRSNDDRCQDFVAASNEPLPQF